MMTFEFYVLCPFADTDRGTFETRTADAETEQEAFEKLATEAGDAVTVVREPIYSCWPCED